MLFLFQFKINHRILGVRSLLFKMGISPNDICGLCGNHCESLMHLFVECEHSNRLWLTLATDLNITCNLNAFDNITKIFGYQHRTNFAEALNTLLIIVRYHVFIKSKNKSILSYIEVKKCSKRYI